MRKEKPGRRRTARGERDRVTASTGNVFADLGFRDADELAAKVDLARAIRHLVEERGLSQRAAAPIVRVTQPELSRLWQRRLDGFSIDRLCRILTALDQDVRIVVHPKSRSRRHATVRTQLRARIKERRGRPAAHHAE